MNVDLVKSSCRGPRNRRGFVVNEEESPQIVGSRYVVKSLEAALWAFHDANDFRDAALKSVNLGHDADTAGAICGQLAEAHRDESGNPAEWLPALSDPGSELLLRDLR